jgi:hypothetical protein
VGALNGISGLLWPCMLARTASGFPGPFHAVGSFWVTLGMATMFVFGATLLVQGGMALVFLLLCSLVSVYVPEPSLEFTQMRRGGNGYRFVTKN